MSLGVIVNIQDFHHRARHTTTGLMHGFPRIRAQRIGWKMTLAASSFYRSCSKT
jgi:hypothetical protein